MFILQYLLYAFYLYIVYFVYKFAIKGLIFGIKTKLKHKDKTSLWFFPVFGGIIEFVLYETFKYGAPYR